MLGGDGQHRFHADLAGGGQFGGGMQEALHRRTWGVDDKGDRVARRFVTDGVRSAAGQRHRLTSCLPTERGREVIALAQGMVPELESAVAHELSEERLVTLREDLETIRQAALTYKNSLRASSVG